MDDIWCNKKRNNEKNSEDNIKTLKNELQKKPSNPLNNLLYNKFPFSNFFKNDFNPNNLKKLNFNNLNNKNILNSNNLIDHNKIYNNTNNSFYIQNKIQSYNNNLINFNKYHPIQIGSTISTSSDTKTTSQESNNWQIIKKYLNQNDINKQFQMTQSNFYSAFYDNNNHITNFNINSNNNNNNNSNFSSTFPLSNPKNNNNKNNNNYLKQYYSTTNIFQNPNLNCENEYTINIKNIIQGREKRTSVRIKNIPVKYSNQDLMKEIDSRMGFNKNMNYRNYDLFYLPMNYSNTRNLGYAFINFVDPICIIDFIHRFNGIKLKSNNCHKECQITFAKYQGRKEIIEHLFNFSGEGKKPFLFTINKMKLIIRVPKKYYEEIKKYRDDIINFLEVYD